MMPEPISPPSGDAIATAVRDRLRRLGRDPDIVTADALRALRAHCPGPEHRLQSLLTAVLFLASTDDATEITAALVERAAAETDLEAAPIRPQAAIGLPVRRCAVPALRPRRSDRLVPPMDGRRATTNREASLAIVTAVCVLAVATALSLLLSRPASIFHSAAPVAQVSDPLSSAPSAITPFGNAPSGTTPPGGRSPRGGHPVRNSQQALGRAIGEPERSPVATGLATRPDAWGIRRPRVDAADAAEPAMV